MNFILAAWIAGIASVLFSTSELQTSQLVVLYLLGVGVCVLALLGKHWLLQTQQTLCSIVLRCAIAWLMFWAGHQTVYHSLHQHRMYSPKTVSPISGVFLVNKIPEWTTSGVQQQALRVDVQPAQSYRLQLRQMKPRSQFLNSAVASTQNQNQPQSQNQYQVQSQLNRHEDVPTQQQGLEIGRYYRIQGVFKPAHSYAVPNVFDIERWYLSQRWQGRVQVRHVELLSPSQVTQQVMPSVLHTQQGYWPALKFAAERLRARLREQLQQMPVQQRGLLLALLTGDKSLLSNETTALFQRFGLAHLLAISGPHVLLLGFMLCWVVQRCIKWQYPNLYLWQPRQRLLLLPFVLAVLLYAAFVGFEIPAQRTLLSVCLVTLIALCNAAIRPLQLMLCSAAVLLWLDPLSIFSAAFWLSYGACFVLLRVYQTLQKQENKNMDSVWSRAKVYVQLLWASQWRIFLALLPLTLWIFAKVSWIAPFANLIAVPVLGVLVVPLNIVAALLSLITPALAQPVWLLADLILRLLLGLLHGSDQLLAPSLFAVSFGTVQIAALALATFMLFMPRSSVPKSWVVLALIPLLGWSGLHRAVAPQLTVVDVGQGQAVLLRDAEHNILIDTGGYYDEQRFSVATQILLPYLRGQGIRQLDRVILSHLDQDHSGAYPALAEAMPVHMLQANERPAFVQQTPFTRCAMGQNLSSAQFELRILWPPPHLNASAIAANQNDYSCVVHVHFKHAKSLQNFLIMGDAGFMAENALMQQYPDLKVDVLLLGHHGSKHSSSAAFLAHYRPQLSIASAGFNNRYGHPSKEVVARLQQYHMAFLNTANTGSIHFSPNAATPYVLARNTRPWLQQP